jgi:hypothetical protein
MASLFSTLVVPTRMGWPRSWLLEDLGDDRRELLALGLVDEVVVVLRGSLPCWSGWARTSSL